MANESFMALLDDLSIAMIAGDQRHEYLHGQITVATKNFDAGKAKIAAHCDFKGKMFSAMVVSEFEDRFLLCMHKESALESLAQLKKYGVFSKVEIALHEDLNIVGIAGNSEIKTLKALFPDIQSIHMQVTSNEFGQTVCFDDTSLRYLCYLTEKGKQRLLDKSNTNEFASAQLWNMLEIEAGIGNIQKTTIGQFVPQMLNFQSISAIEFDKGCYMGQEVVARTKFLGKNKRATFLLETSEGTQANLISGHNVEVQIGDSWRRGGVVVRAAIDDAKQLKMLAVLPNDTTIGSLVRLKDTNIELRVMPMPYEVTS